MAMAMPLKDAGERDQGSCEKEVGRKASGHGMTSNSSTEAEATPETAKTRAAETTTATSSGSNSSASSNSSTDSKDICLEHTALHEQHPATCASANEERPDDTSDKTKRPRTQPGLASTVSSSSPSEEAAAAAAATSSATLGALTSSDTNISNSSSKRNRNRRITPVRSNSVRNFLLSSSSSSQHSRNSKRPSPPPSRRKETAEAVASRRRTAADARTAGAATTPSRIILKPSTSMSFLESPREALIAPADIDRIVVNAGLGTLSLWIGLLVIVYSTAPAENIVYLEGAEHNAAAFACTALCFSIVLTLIPYIVGTPMKRLSGILLAAIIVQFVAMTTNAIMVFGPTVVMDDPVTKSRVYLTRWCEWGPLAGFMTLLSESVDLSADPKQRRMQYGSAVMQLISAVCGLFLPMCPGVISWTIVMTISCVTYLLIFPRIWFRWKRLKLFMDNNGSTPLRTEMIERLQFAFRLIFCCGCVWTFLVVVYFANMAIHTLTPLGHPLRIDGLPMIVDTIFDLTAKILYMKIISTIHDSVFDKGGQVRRRLQELRHMLSVLWESSSDAIVISVESGPKQVSSMISPTFACLIDHVDAKKHHALVVESEIEKQPAQQNLKSNDDETKTDNVDDSKKSASGGLPAFCLVAKRAYWVNAAVPFEPSSLQHTTAIPLSDHSIHEAMFIINTMWECEDTQDTIPHDIITNKRNVAKCEITVTKQNDNAIIGIIRDHTEQYLLGESEQRNVMESQARQKDAQAVNRFTRHEVKNGLLASIELCDCLRSNINEQQQLNSHVLKQLNGIASSLPASTDMLDGPIQTRVEELERVLHEILDTVLAEAMARDVIHGVYRPNLERVNVMVVLKTVMLEGGTTDRFKIEVDSENAPFLLLDSQLLKYIHRNAVSNACKYGKDNGEVVTSVSFDEKTQEFVMKVTNLPGPNHDELVAMGPEATEGVFKQGKRLHSELKMNKEIVSSGDGAWIMSKCAKTLRGECSIHFSPEKTTFMFRCPSKQYSDLTDALKPWGEPKNFTLPEGTWAIAVDDSLIQRKLLGKIIENAGVPKERCILLGKSSEEIRGFGAKISSIMTENPDANALILMDENLEMVEDGRHMMLSGSRLLHEVLLELPPEDEKRILALVRSANDSGEDVEVYTSRCHGFFPKAPMKRDRVRELLASLWIRRFHSEDDSSSDLDAEEEALRKEIAKALFFASSLISDGVTVSRWPQIWTALWDLRSKLQDGSFSPKVKVVVALIGGMQNKGVPGNFEEKWKLIRETVDDAVLKNW